MSFFQACRAPLRALAIASAALALSGCYAKQRDVTGSIPNDYRKRHPITIQERDRSLELLVGDGRGGLTPVQRAEVLAFAHRWRREATAGFIIDRPVNTPNERAANDSLRETLSILAGAGVPQHGIAVRPYSPPPTQLAALRVRYPTMRADAGPCGLWPDDLGPTYDRRHFENRPYYNLGCATQRNLAAMVAEPQDLLQPRSESPAYEGKRSIALDKWRRGESPTTQHRDATKGMISDVAKQ